MESLGDNDSSTAAQKCFPTIWAFFFRDPKGYQVIVNDHNSGHLDGEEVIYNVKSIERVGI